MCDIFIDVSVVWTIIWFLIGSGLVGLGAFFLLRILPFKQWTLLLVGLIPVIVFILCDLVVGQTELALYLIWGTVVVNLALIGLLEMCCGVRLGRKDKLLMTWLGIGLLGSYIAACKGGVGLFSGCALLITGLIAVLNCGHDKNEVVVARKHCSVWCGLSVFAVLIVLVVGTWFIVANCVKVSVVCGVNTGAFVLVVLASLFSGIGCLSMCGQKALPKDLFVQQLLRINLILVTVGMGLLGMTNNNLHVPQSLVCLVMPAGIVLWVVLALTSLMPKKTTRWWGGLVLGLYLALVIALLR